MGVWRDIRPDGADQDRSPIERILLDQFAPAVGKAADHGSLELPDGAVGKIHAPLTGLGVVEEDGHSLPVALWTIRFNFFHLSATVPELVDVYSSIQFDRLVRSGQRMHPPDNVRLPCAEVEVEVMAAITLSSGGRDGLCLGRTETCGT